MPDAFSRIVRAAKTVENARRCLKTLPEHEATEAIDELARRLGYKVLAILFPEGRETEWWVQIPLYVGLSTGLTVNRHPRL